MLKLISLTISALLSTIAFAAESPVYQVELNVKKAGKSVSSSSLIIAEGRKGSIKNSAMDSTGTDFEVTVSQGKLQKLSMDYRFIDKGSKQSIEVSKTAVELKPGGTEKCELKDSSGDDLTLEIAVSERSGQADPNPKIKQKFEIPETEAN